jgi:sugar phosphate isomerase/epimerase
MVSALEAAGAGAVELDYRLTAARLRELSPLLRTAGMAVVSLHNFCPIPPVLRGTRGGGDLFSLSDPEPELRRTAVYWTEKTLEQAHELEAGAVVLHCGAVAFEHEEERWHALVRDGLRDSEPTRAFIERKLGELRRRKGPYLDALLFSLDRLVRAAERLGVVLGLENRFHYHELPGPEDYGRVFGAFDGGPLGYWHDMGHAHAAEVRGSGGGQGLLSTFASRLVGIHVHDAAGFSDHLPPGEGEVDFGSLAGVAGGSVPLVIELRPGTSAETAAAGRTRLEAVLGSRTGPAPGEGPSKPS